MDMYLHPKLVNDRKLFKRKFRDVNFTYAL